MNDKQELLMRMLFSSYPVFQSGNVETTIMAYEIALAGFDADDIEQGLKLLIRGDAPGQNPSFAPPAPFVSALVRGIRDRRLDDINSRRAAVKQIEGRDVTKDIPLRLNRMDAVNEALARSVLFKEKREETPIEREEREKARAEYLKRHDEFFKIDMSDAAIKRRLGFAVGDLDSEHDAA